MPLLLSLRLLSPGVFQGQETGAADDVRQKVVYQNVVVQPGDTLWSLSQKYLKDPRQWPQIVQHNAQLSSDVTVALPGMLLKVPLRLVKERYRSAEMVYLRNEVSVRRRETPDWKSAQMKMILFPEDALRTMVLSEARVLFGTGDILSLRENSHAVLLPPKLQTELLKGELRVQGVVQTMTASAKITPKPGTDYMARITPTNSTVVQVYRGSADVEAEGKSVAVNAGFATEVKLGRAPSAPTTIPPEAVIATGLVKSQEEKTRFRLDRQRISLELGKGNGQEGDTDALAIGMPIQGYRLQISRRENFNEVTIDKFFDVAETVDLGKNLPKGAYWWRVALVDLLGAEGNFSKPTPFEIK